MNVFDKNIIDLNLKATTKNEAFDEMAEMLLKEGYISNTEEFKKSLYEREEMGITGIGNQVAIPHGKSDAVLKVGLAVGRADHDIEWETHDGKPVRVVLMFSVANDEDFEKTHLRMLASVATKLAHEEVLDKLMSAKTSEEIIEILS